MRLIGWSLLIGIGGLSYALVVVDDAVKSRGGNTLAMLRLMRPSTIQNFFTPPPDLRAQKDDTYEPVVDTQGFKQTDCLEAKGARYTHPKLAALVNRECLAFGINTLD